MSRIDRLQIQGVRSFDHRHGSAMKFFSPLTLIVGSNGSGKTTIIECLKYATTGELPPNSKGGAFIHDPKLAGEKEVMAQAKLKFFSTSGAEMTVTRSLQLTVKKTARTQKTLDCSLVIKKNAESTAISTRVAELDQLIPQYLGVSTAVLESVIFCHQDESLWPMSEPSVLKKKFDEIFEAQKYTKAIDNIKQLRKKQNEELGKFKLLEQHAKSDKDQADKSQKRMTKLADEIDALGKEYEKLETEMSLARDQADKAWKESETYAQVLGQLEGKKIEAQGKRRTLDDLKIHLKEVPESDEWLESTLEKYESRLIQYREQEDSRKEAYIELRRQVQSNREILGSKQKKAGEFENDKAQYERNLVRRSGIVRDIAERHNIRGFEDSIDEHQFEEFMRRLRRLSKDQTNLLSKSKQEGSAEVREAQTLRNQLDRREESLQHDKSTARQQMSTNEREILEYQKRADAIAVDEGSKAITESKIEDVTSKLQKAKSAAEKASNDQHIADADTKLRSFEDETTRLNGELIQGTKKASEMAQLDHLKKELKDRHRSLETMVGAHRQRIEKLIGADWEPSTVENVYQDTATERVKDLQLAERKRDGVSRELEQLEFRLKTVRTTLGQKKSEATTAKARVRKAIDAEPEEFEEILDERQKQLDFLKSDISSFTGMEDYMTKCLASLEEKNCCRTCLRPFKTPAESANFKRKIEALIKKSRSEYNEEEVGPLEAEVAAIREAAIDYEAWQRLSTVEIPELQKQEATLDLERDDLLGKIESHDQQVNEKGEAKRDVESLSKSVSTIARYENEIKGFERQIEDLQSKQSQQGLSRTLEDIQDEISAVGEKARTTRQLIAKLTSEREQSRTNIANLELDLSNLRAELGSVNFELDKKAGILARTEEIRALNRKQRDAIRKADEDLEKLGPQIAQATTRYDDIVERTELREREVQADATNLSDHVHQLEISNDQIRSYVDRDGPRELARAQREIGSIEDEILRLEGDQASITVEINRITSQLNDSEATKRQYSDNLRYRQEGRALQVVDVEIEKLTSRNADVDRSRFQKESQTWTKKHNDLSAQAAGVRGESKAKDNELKGLIDDYEVDFKDAAKRYRESHIRVETTKAAIEDLGRYGSALDKAVMTYHSLKMEEINAIIAELWRDTYQGTDVDTILIRSDNENAKGNRNYNYRVSMVKQDAEMDMRGRCSAGQKVLASIIIRLALAECFGLNCGVIALDEPTTNLDRDNIRSLAESLHTIIEARKKQSNFQLIVITHDEEFLRYMKCNDFVDYYWRVSRDDSQKSIIEKQSIAEVF